MYGTEVFCSLMWFEPCGVWQFRQLYRTGACSQMNGPRFSVWQV